jgi:hypothetical protein
MLNENRTFEHGKFYFVALDGQFTISWYCLPQNCFIANDDTRIEVRNAYIVGDAIETPEVNQWLMNKYYNDRKEFIKYYEPDYLPEQKLRMLYEYQSILESENQLDEYENWLLK